MTWPAQGPLPHPEPRKAQAVCSLGSVRPPRTPETPRGWAALVAAPGLDISPTDGLCHRASVSGSARKCFCVDGALCPGDSNVGMSPRSHTGSPLAQPRVLNGIQTQTAVALGAPSFETCCPAAPCPHCTLTQEADPGEAVVTQEAGRGTLVCSPPKLSSRAKRKSEEREWNAHQPLNRGGFLSLRLLTKAPSSHHTRGERRKLFL